MSVLSTPCLFKVPNEFQGVDTRPDSKFGLRKRRVLERRVLCLVTDRNSQCNITSPVPCPCVCEVFWYTLDVLSVPSNSRLISPLVLPHLRIPSTNVSRWKFQTFLSNYPEPLGPSSTTLLRIPYPSWGSFVTSHHRT